MSERKERKNQIRIDQNAKNVNQSNPALKCQESSRSEIISLEQYMRFKLSKKSLLYSAEALARKMGSIIPITNLATIPWGIRNPYPRL